MNKVSTKILQAAEEDLPLIMQMIKSVVGEMNLQKNLTHWNETYPTIETFRQDLKKNSLFVLKLDEKTIIGTIVLTLMTKEGTELPEYEEVDWRQKRKDRYMMISRLAVDPKHQGMGYGKELIRFGEKYCLEKGYESIRLDTIHKSLNIKNIGLYEKCGFKFMKIVYFKGRKDYFTFFEKVIVAKAKL